MILNRGIIRRSSLPEIDGGGVAKPLAISLLMKNNEDGRRKISNRTSSLLPGMNDYQSVIPPKTLMSKESLNIKARGGSIGGGQLSPLKSKFMRSRNLVPISATATF